MKSNTLPKCNFYERMIIKWILCIPLILLQENEATKINAGSFLAPGLPGAGLSKLTNVAKSIKESIFGANTINKWSTAKAIGLEGSILYNFKHPDSWIRSRIKKKSVQTGLIALDDHPVCKRLYGTFCPIGWIYSSEGFCECQNGPCKCGRRKELRSLTIEARKLWAYDCGEKYHCEPTCFKDYNAICPIGWIYDEIMDECRALETFYTPSCVTVIPNAGSKTINERRKFSKDCHAPYPCLKKLIKKKSSLWGLRNLFKIR